MTETTITVQGRYSAYYPAERATVSVSAHLEGADRASVFEATASSADLMRALIEAGHDRESGPITWFSSDVVQVWTEKPWSQAGEQLPPVFHSRVQFRVKFSEFVALAVFVEQIAAIAGATVGYLEWDLTESSRASRIAEVRSRAVKDAVAKAAVYAQSIGLGTVRAIAIADSGMLGDTGPAEAGGHDQMGMLRMAGAPSGDPGPALELTPEDIELSAVVDARFVAT